MESSSESENYDDDHFEQDDEVQDESLIISRLDSTTNIIDSEMQGIEQTKNKSLAFNNAPSSSTSTSTSTSTQTHDPPLSTKAYIPHSNLNLQSQSQSNLNNNNNNNNSVLTIQQLALNNSKPTTTTTINSFSISKQPPISKPCVELSPAFRIFFEDDENLNNAAPLETTKQPTEEVEISRLINDPIESDVHYYESALTPYFSSANNRNRNKLFENNKTTQNASKRAKYFNSLEDEERELKFSIDSRQKLNEVSEEGMVYDIVMELLSEDLALKMGSEKTEKHDEVIQREKTKKSEKAKVERVEKGMKGEKVGEEKEKVKKVEKVKSEKMEKVDCDKPSKAKRKLNKGDTQANIAERFSEILKEVEEDASFLFSKVGKNSERGKEKEKKKEDEKEWKFSPSLVDALLRETICQMLCDPAISNMIKEEVYVKLRKISSTYTPKNLEIDKLTSSTILSNNNNSNNNPVTPSTRLPSSFSSTIEITKHKDPKKSQTTKPPLKNTHSKVNMSSSKKSG